MFPSLSLVLLVEHRICWNKRTGGQTVSTGHSLRERVPCGRCTSAWCVSNGDAPRDGTLQREL